MSVSLSDEIISFYQKTHHALKADQKFLIQLVKAIEQRDPFSAGVASKSLSPQIKKAFPLLTIFPWHLKQLETTTAEEAAIEKLPTFREVISILEILKAL